MKHSCAMGISDGRVTFNTPEMSLNLSLEDFETMMGMYELITNNYYASDFCFSDENGKVTVGSTKDLVK